MVIQFENFNVTSNFQIKYKLLRFIREAENMNSHFCTQHPPVPTLQYPIRFREK